VQESGWLEEPGGKQELGEGLPIKHSWHGHGSGVRREAWHGGVKNHQDTYQKSDKEGNMSFSSP